MSFRTTALLLCIFPIIIAKTGFDASAAVSYEKFQCLKEKGFDFFIARVFRSLGKVDNIGVNNIRNAKNAKWTDVGGYIFPCPKPTCPSPEEQVTQTIHALGAYEAEVEYLWIDVEIYNWPNDKTFNRDFIARMVKTVQEAPGYKVGIYSNNYNWQQIVGLDWKPFPEIPLWWARYNKKPGFEAFQPFGGWEKPTIHQYNDNQFGPCDVRMDLNYKE